MYRHFIKINITKLGHILFYGWLAIIILLSPAKAEVPYLGTPYIIDETTEYNIGQAWIRQFKAYKLTTYDVLIQDYLEKLVNHLIIYEHNLKNKNTQILLVNDSSFNAFAVPGGIIGVNLGLFRYIPEEGELAAILSHEIGHLSQHHFVRRLEDNIKNLSKQLFGIISSIFIGGLTQNADIVQAGIFLTRGQSINQALYYSRFQEKEADRIGLQILTAAGFNAKSMAMAFGRMQHQIILNGGNPPQFLITHPLTETRIADINARIDAKNFTSYRLENTRSDINYKLIRIRASMLSYLPQIIAPDNLKLNTTLENNYAYYLYFLRKKQFARAEIYLKNALAKHKYNLILNYSLAELYYQWQKPQQATKILTNLLEFNDNYYPALYLMALHGNTANKANQKSLEKLANIRKNDEQIWLSLYEISKKNKDFVKVHTSKAEYLQLIGDFNSALAQLSYAESNSKYLDFPTQARILNRIKELEQMQKNFSFE